MSPGMSGREEAPSNRARHATDSGLRPRAHRGLAVREPLQPARGRAEARGVLAIASSARSRLP